MNGEEKITTSHRSRLAIIYLRQSTMLQVRDHSESTTRQYALVDLAVALGWTAENILVIDKDLGVSGRFGVERGGFHDVVAKVCLAEAGAVFGLEVSRLARSNADIARLLELARLTDTLVVDSDAVYDLADFNDRLLLGLKGSMSEAELHLLNGRLQGAKQSAAARGDLRVPLPVGLDYDEDGNVVLDADEEVRTAVADVFSEFARTGSAYGVVAALAGRLFPLRAYGGVWDGKLRWGKLTHGRVLGVLANPAYAGAYVYGRHRTQRTVRPDGSVLTTNPRLPRADWRIVINDHHDGYITWQQFLDIEAKLTANCTHQGARPPREGEPLCQGIISCGGCGCRIGTRYQGKNRLAQYDCMGHRDAARTTSCRSVTAATVDGAVVGLLLATLTPALVSLALDAAEQVTQRHTRAHHAAELAVERARYEANRAERAFGQVEPENRLVARTLEVRWEAKLGALNEAEANLVATREARPPLPGRAALESLAADLPRLWDDPATTAKDRKRLLRTLISDVTVLPDSDQGEVRIGVRWHTGATDLITTARSGAPRTPPAAIELITRLGAIMTDEELVAELAAARLQTGKRRPFDVKAVRWTRHAYQIPVPDPFREGEISIQRTASILEVTAGVVYYWVNQGLLSARKDDHGRWCIPWSEAIETNCRRQIAASGHLTPPHPRPARGTALDGEVTVAQAADLLGVGEHVIYYRIRIGDLPAHRTEQGRLSIPLTDTLHAHLRDRLAHSGQPAVTGEGSRPLPEAARARDEISVQQAATRLKVLAAVVYYQVRAGHLQARRTATGRIAILWNDEIHTRIRAQLAADPPGPTGIGSRLLPTGTTARGELSVQNAAKQLGIRPGALYYWIRRGELAAHKTKDGRLSIPWSNSVKAACLQRAAHGQKFTPQTQEVTAGGAV
ncbi:recombinase family protein [Streptomyces sp. A5-4]|uniref:recombinase family protein n=1 Tax=Streptomyces sp. A5-4 TaxID=3384771 RepID=UPI003DA84087